MLNERYFQRIAYPGAISEPLLDAKAQMKKPPNAFFLYCKENRDSVKKLVSIYTRRKKDRPP